MGKKHEGNCHGKKSKIMEITGRSAQTAQRVCDVIIKKG